MTDVRDGNLVDWSHRGVPAHVQCYAQEGGIMALYDTLRDKHVCIQIVGMTRGEIDRSIVVALAMLGNEPVNRHQARRGKHLSVVKSETETRAMLRGLERRGTMN